MKNIKTRVYACGGCGVNLAQMVRSVSAEICYIDTSLSNRTDGLDPDRCHFIADLDGSGKLRRENYNQIAKEIGPIMDQFEPADFNIVLFSAAGGSGSVLGPLLVRALLQADYATVAVVVGDDVSNIAVTNTTNTMKSLEAISLSVNRPVVVSYHENTQGVSRQSVDDEVLFVLETLGILTDQDNAELDTQDLINWVQYHKVTGLQPQLSTLFVSDNRQAASSILEPIAVASLWADKAKQSPFGNPHYVTEGFPRSGTTDFGDQLHFVINVVGVDEVFKHLTERQTDLNRQYANYRQRKTVVDVDDAVTSDGLIL